MDLTSKIFITEFDDFLGASISRRLRKSGYSNLIGDQVDLLHLDAIENHFQQHNPDVIFLAVGPSAGIQGNIEYPGDLMYLNLVKGLNVISSAKKFGIQNIIYVASSCVYPRLAEQPLQESSILTGPLEPTNEAYAMAKLATLKLCEAFNTQHKTNFISMIPANPYGPMDSFDLKKAHVITALIARMIQQRNEKSIEIWGTGNAIRDFIYVDDVADAAIFLANHNPVIKTVNVSAGDATSIRSLAELIKDVVGFKGNLIFDAAKPEGMPKKIIDGRQIFEMGWKPATTLRNGIEQTYRWYLNNFVD